MAHRRPIFDNRETAFIFPPRGLERTVVGRAKSDGVRAAFVVPTAYKAGYWEAHRGRSVAQLQLDDPASDFALAQAPLGDDTLFLVDFGRSDSTTPACGQECKLRGRRELFGPVELEERARVKAELLRLEAEQALRARPAPTAPSSQG